MELEEQRICEPAQVLETALGASLLHASNLRFPHDSDCAGKRHGGEYRRHRKREFVALHEFSTSVSSTCRTRQDRFEVQIAANVGGKFRWRTIAASAILFQSLHCDPVKVSTQQAG